MEKKKYRLLRFVNRDEYQRNVSCLERTIPAALWCRKSSASSIGGGWTAFGENGQSALFLARFGAGLAPVPRLEDPRIMLSSARVSHDFHDRPRSSRNSLRPPLLRLESFGDRFVVDVSAFLLRLLRLRHLSSLSTSLCTLAP
ncbi:hypothetical protein LshimejAT787_0311740 [Lyophyllum shimeji]|uniref:Uncharacterized protein n=1 Tax=Lyophyllum shimeji TaxID=47721 RepID=A0A9P3PKA7_LYOSH|nr:hypothetical protein LshimejAT787_0311740 [Lyophyllum shimeji]